MGNAATSTTVLARPSTGSPTQVSPYAYGESSRQGAVNSPHPHAGMERGEYPAEWSSTHNRRREHSPGDRFVGVVPSHGRGLAQELQQELSRASSSSSLASGYANVRGYDVREHSSNMVGDRYYVEGSNPRDSPGRHRPSYSHFRSSTPLDTRSLISPTSQGRTPFQADTLPPVASESLEHYRFGRRRTPSPAGEARSLGPAS